MGHQQEWSATVTLSRSRIRQIKRIEQGKCAHCNQPQVYGITLCQKHREQANEQTLRAYYRRKEKLKLAKLQLIDRVKSGETLKPIIV